MIVLLGDIHGTYQRVEQLDAQLDPGIPILQVGDFGWYPSIRPYWNQLGPKLQRPVYWIDGNHEYFPDIPLDAATPVEMAPNIHYVPRGTLLELDGLRIGCMGGAASVDYKYRKLDRDWFLEENIGDDEMRKADSWGQVDLMVTHVPPQWVIQKHFDRSVIKTYGLHEGWQDPNADLVEYLWTSLGQPPLVCGHMHRAIKDGSVRILDINEAIEFDGSR